MTYDTKGVWRCYEIKTSVSDFRSKSKNTFVGHLNYYVMPHELFTKVRDEIPAHIGVYVNGISVDKRAKRQELLIDEQVLKDSFIRSLDREHQKFYKSQSKTIIQNTERKLRNLEQSKERYQQENRRLTMHLQHKFGRNWRQIIGWE
ncbi:hypothetical protein [Geomicrobium sp. JCM 19037]|uniref:hypothetical protein n=1 Tax=Geomicrobium sp. JCM 19037 TaxID=1460634 RepID=UPI0005AA46ED|nr:hypothetical protein [Geomicrobium sp. JCM 19037]